LAGPAFGGRSLLTAALERLPLFALLCGRFALRAAGCAAVTPFSLNWPGLLVAATTGIP